MRTMRVLSMSRRERRGFHTMELLLAVPILAVLFLAGLAYGRVMMLRSGLTYAATAGAREAGKGGDILNVAERVNRVLAVYDFAITPGHGSRAKVILETGPAVVAEFGDPDIPFLPAFPLQPGEVRVTVLVRFDAKRTDGVRRLLPFCTVLGSTFAGQRLTAQSLAKFEGMSL